MKEEIPMEFPLFLLSLILHENLNTMKDSLLKKMSSFLRTKLDIFLSLQRKLCSYGNDQTDKAKN